MKFCIECGKELEDGAKFCANCGKEVISSQTETKSQRKTTYEGEIHKCPNCGEVLKSFVVNCPACGYELRSVKSNSPVNELAQKVEKAETVDKKIELITNFYVPNTKEDIYDFFILAVSNLEDTNYDTDDAWLAKLEQTYHKAKLSFCNDSEFAYIEESYKKTIAKVSKRGTMNFVRKNKKLCLSTLLVGVGIIMLIVGIIIMSSVSMEENWGSSYGGIILLILGINFLLGPAWVYGIAKENENEKNKKADGRENLQEVGKETVEELKRNFQTIADQFKSIGKNRKGV